MKSTFNHPIHAFRGFAIFNVLIIHCFGFAHYYAKTIENSDQDFLAVLLLTMETLFHDSTLYFALISGTLFTLILEKRGWTTFFKSKGLNIVLPYLFFTFLFSWSSWNDEGEHILFSGSFLEFIQLLSYNLVTGEAIFTFWYIPVLLGLYLLTPLFSKILVIDTKGWFVLALLLFPLLLSRTWPEFSWTNYAYFGGAYLLGMLVGKHYKKTIELLSKAFWWLVIGASISSVTIYYFLAFKFEPYGLTSPSESAWYFQKLCFAGLALLFFERCLKTTPGWLKLLGDYAFPLYFIHAYLLFAGYPLFEFSQFPATTPIGILILCILNVIFITLINIALIYMFKIVLGDRSKYFIGA